MHDFLGPEGTLEGYVMSYFLRGFGNTGRAKKQRRPPPIMTFDPATREVAWEHFKEKLGTQWRGLKA